MQIGDADEDFDVLGTFFANPANSEGMIERVNAVIKKLTQGDLEDRSTNRLQLTPYDDFYLVDRPKPRAKEGRITYVATEFPYYSTHEGGLIKTTLKCPSPESSIDDCRIFKRFIPNT